MTPPLEYSSKERREKSESTKKQRRSEKKRTKREANRESKRESRSRTPHEIWRTNGHHPFGNAGLPEKPTHFFG